MDPKKIYVVTFYHRVGEPMQKSYYAIIPANVRYDKDLPPNAKLLYGEITALCNEKGYCWAGNTYFSDLYSVNKVTISRWIAQLITRGYITSKIQYKEGTKQIVNRYLQICNDPINEIVNTPIDKIVKDNNTVINNTNNNAYSNEFEQFWAIYPRKLDKKKAYTKFKTIMKAHSLISILDGTKKYAQQVQHTESKFIKHPATFLNNESFIDGYEEQQEQVTPSQQVKTESALAGMWGVEDYE